MKMHFCPTHTKNTTAYNILSSRCDYHRLSFFPRTFREWNTLPEHILQLLKHSKMPLLLSEVGHWVLHWALSKTCRDAGTTPGQYNRQRRRQRRRHSRDAVLSVTVVQWAITTIQAGTTLRRRRSRDNRQPSVQHQILLGLSEDALIRAVSIKDNNACLLMLLLEFINKTIT